MMAGFLSGVFRNAIMDVDVKVKLIPVDFAVNLIIAVAWKTSLNFNNECSFYNCTDYPSNQITWGELKTHTDKIYKRFVPYEKIIYYPGSFVTSNFYVFSVAFFFTQFLPGLLFDVYLKFSGQKTL